VVPSAALDVSISKQQLLLTVINSDQGGFLNYGTIDNGWWYVTSSLQECLSLCGAWVYYNFVGLCFIAFRSKIAIVVIFRWCCLLLRTVITSELTVTKADSWILERLTMAD
jgi:hypothetical protein